MISKQQYKFLVSMKKNIKKRINDDVKDETIIGYKDSYLQAKKNPENLNIKDVNERKNVIKNRKVRWKKAHLKINTPLNEKEMQILIARLEKYPKWKIIDVQLFINELNLNEYIKQDGKNYVLPVKGDQAIEEYLLEKRSKILLPWIAIGISILAFGASVAALLIG